MCERRYIRYSFPNIKDEYVQKTLRQRPRYRNSQSPQSQEVPRRAANTLPTLSQAN